MTFRDQISEFLNNHPRLSPHRLDNPNNKKMRRYVTTGGNTVVHEHNLSEVQHIWVPSTDRALSLRGRIEMTSYPARALYVSSGPNGKQYGRHSGLKTLPEFAEADLLRLTPKDLGEVASVIDILD